uniref:Uncharacterized protein n=1 Tax=Anguilla anguilla TaxID=7936 RepID=A0A0E9WJ14_ANGAN
MTVITHGLKLVIPTVFCFFTGQTWKMFLIHHQLCPVFLYSVGFFAIKGNKEIFYQHALHFLL